MFKLSQTLAGNWVITIPNPEEKGWETQLAEFKFEAVTPGSHAAATLEDGVVCAYAAFIRNFPDSEVSISTHDPESYERMHAAVEAALS